MKNEWGFTNDKAELDAIVSFREAAIADGWAVAPTYPNSEPMGSAASLSKGGFKMMVTARAKTSPFNKYCYEANVNIWGPDGLAIVAPETYSWDAIVKGLRHCEPCGADDVDTVRFSFAGRCCQKCLPEMRKQHEYPGWCD